MGRCPEKLKFLLVDDDERVRKVMANMIKSRCRGIIYEADGAASALHLLREIKFDVMITDVVMPGMDGYQLAELALDTYGLPTILVTGYRAEDVIPDEVKHGMVCCLAKPFTMTDLEEAVLKAIKNQCILKEDDDHDKVAGDGSQENGEDWRSNV